MKIAGCDIAKKEIESFWQQGRRYIVKHKSIWEIRYSDAQRGYYATKIYQEVREGVNLSRRGRFSVVDYAMVNYMLGCEMLQA